MSSSTDKQINLITYIPPNFDYILESLNEFKGYPFWGLRFVISMRGHSYTNSGSDLKMVKITTH